MLTSIKNIADTALHGVDRILSRGCLKKRPSPQRKRNFDLRSKILVLFTGFEVTTKKVGLQCRSLRRCQVLSVGTTCVLCRSSSNQKGGWGKHH